jgi:hypothetical protein
VPDSPSLHVPSRAMRCPLVLSAGALRPVEGDRGAGCGHTFLWLAASHGSHRARRFSEAANEGMRAQPQLVMLMPASSAHPAPPYPPPQTQRELAIQLRRDVKPVLDKQGVKLYLVASE